MACETAALTHAFNDARSTLAKAAELTARRDGSAEAARLLAQGVAALKAQDEALDKSRHETGRLAEAIARQAKDNGWKSEVTGQSIAEMNRESSLLESSLRVHTGNMGATMRARSLRFNGASQTLIRMINRVIVYDRTLGRVSLHQQSAPNPATSSQVVPA